jgi:hypothetical protein
MQDESAFVTSLAVLILGKYGQKCPDGGQTRLQPPRLGYENRAGSQATFVSCGLTV